MANASRDDNSIPTLLGVSSGDGLTPIRVYADPVTHRLLIQSGGGGGTGTWYSVSGTIDGSNVTFTIPVVVASDFVLMLARQPQMQDVGAQTWDYSYSTGGGVTTITYHTAPDGSLSGQPHLAFVVS